MGLRALEMEYPRGLDRTLESWSVKEPTLNIGRTDFPAINSQTLFTAFDLHYIQD